MSRICLPEQCFFFFPLSLFFIALAGLALNKLPSGNQRSGMPPARQPREGARKMLTTSCTCGTLGAGSWLRMRQGISSRREIRHTRPSPASATYQEPGRRAKRARQIFACDRSQSHSRVVILKDVGDNQDLLLQDTASLV
jgi:hypothetical protein